MVIINSFELTRDEDVINSWINNKFKFVKLMKLLTKKGEALLFQDFSPGQIELNWPFVANQDNPIRVNI